MKELGAYLKRVRVSNGVNIAEAAEDLELTVTELENIEIGNVKAFKDLYDLKNYVKAYSKYLGLNPEKVVDDFNTFFFDLTSKISLDDIKNNQKKDVSKNEKKIKSPYTIEFKKKSYALPIFLVSIVITISIFIIIYVIVNAQHKVPTRTNELAIDDGKENCYELAY